MSTRQALLNCAFESWYPLFAKYSIKSHIIPLSQDFIDYLCSDSIILPSGPIRQRQVDSDWSDEEEETDELPSFPELREKVEHSIQAFGAVFPKLNWSSPKDAAWMACDQTLRCTSFNDVILLLKSSDFIVHDLKYAAQCDPDWQPTFHLVLRCWYNIVPSMEFRCFIKQDELIGACQRDTSQFYDFLIQERDELWSLLTLFYKERIQGRFPEPNVVMDVYVNRQRKVFLMDMNVFDETTDALLFSWSELKQPLKAELRLIDSPHLAQEPPFALNRLPRDVYDYSQGESVLGFMEKFQQACLEQQLETRED